MINNIKRPTFSMSEQKEKTVRLSMDVPANLHKKLRLASISKGETMTEVTIKLIDEFVKKLSNTEFII